MRSIAEAKLQTHDPVRQFRCRPGADERTCSSNQPRTTSVVSRY